MATFRVEKNKSYTVMSNHHLRNNKLSLKAKGLLSQMLSLPEEWDYTLSGLAAINKESKDAIRSAVVELEQAGYIQRRQTTDADGKFAGNEYIIHEEPLSVSPLSGFPTTENPSPGNPLTENPTEINKEGIILGKNSNDGSDDDPFDPMPLFVEWIKKVSSSDWSSEEKTSLYAALHKYSEKRTAIGSPFSSKRSVTLLCNKLKTLSGGKLGSMLSLLKTATDKGWRSVYPPGNSVPAEPSSKGGDEEWL